MYSMLVTGYFLKIAKINSQLQKTIRPNCKNKLPQKFHATRYPANISMGDNCNRMFTCSQAKVQKNDPI